MIDRLVAALRGTGLELDWRDIADVLWLADVRARDIGSEQPADGSPAPAEPRRNAREPTASPRPMPRMRRQCRRNPLDCKRLRRPGHPAGAWQNGAMRTTTGGAGLGAVTPTSYVLPGSMEIGRALQPMKQRRRTPRRKVFDPEATVDLFCDTGVLIPVLRPDQSAGSTSLSSRTHLRRWRSGTIPSRPSPTCWSGTARSAA